MTLLITIVAPWGIWQCSDHRLTDSRGKIRDDFAPKQVTIIAEDGTALLSYTGVAKIGQQYVSDWIAMTLTGKPRKLMASLDYLRVQLSATVGDSQPLILNWGAFMGGKVWFGALSNIRKNWERRKEFMGEFRRKAVPYVAVSGSGRALIEKDYKLLTGIFDKKPKKPKSYFKLLAEVNERCSKYQDPKYGPVISESCDLSFMYPDPTARILRHTEFWGKPAPTKSHAPGLVILGKNLTHLQRWMVESKGKPGYWEPDNPIREIEVNEALKRFTKPDSPKQR